MLSSPDRGGLENYDLVKEVGRGCLSVVYKAVCTRGRLCSRIVALKKVALHQGHGVGKLDVPLESLKLHQELHHPNILALYSTFALPGDYVQVMEYCPKGSLAEYKAIKGPSFREPMALRLLRGLANALVYLQDRQIVHRAIRPTNIFLDANETPKLSHFNSAIRLPSHRPPCDPPTEYTAPEINRGQPGSFPADIWSLACVVLFVLSAQSPNAKITAGCILQNLNCTPQLRGVLSSMLHYSPSNRLDACALVTQEIFLHLAKLPLGRVATSLTNGPSTEQVLSPTVNLPGQKTNFRRVSIGDPGHEQLVASGMQQWTRPARRVVSDPLTSRRIGVSGAVPAARNAAEPMREVASGVALGNHSCPKSGETIKFLSRNYESNAIELRPQFIDTSCLRPQLQKTKDGCVAVLRNGHIFVEFNSCPKGETRTNVMVINSRQNQVSIYEDSIPQESLCHTTPSAQYTRESLPTAFWAQYETASVIIDQMKQRTPKFIMYTNDGKYTLMMNGPPGDVEASFSLVEASRVFRQADDADEITLRIRYSESQGLVELRRYAGGTNGKIWMKKRMTSISNLKEVPHIELARLDKLEKDGLARLIRFSEICKAMEELEPTLHNLDRQGDLDECES